MEMYQIYSITQAILREKLCVIDMSPMYLQFFYCSLLSYYLFWMFNGLYYTLLYYFWAQPINQRPSPNCYFFAYFSVSQKSNIKWSPNGIKPSWVWFLEQTWSRGLGVDVKKEARRPRGREARLPPGCAPTLVGPSQLHRPTSSSYIYIFIYPENI